MITATTIKTAEIIAMEIVITFSVLIDLSLD